MSWKPTRIPSSVSRIWRTLAFRLTAAYASAGLLLVLLATLSLYLVLVSELNKSTELFLKDKVNVLRTMLRERPEDINGRTKQVVTIRHSGKPFQIDVEDLRAAVKLRESPVDRDPECPVAARKRDGIGFVGEVLREHLVG